MLQRAAQGGRSRAALADSFSAGWGPRASSTADGKGAWLGDGGGIAPADRAAPGTGMAGLARIT